MKVLLVATVQSHICQFHKPLVAMLMLSPLFQKCYTIIGMETHIH